MDRFASNQEWTTMIKSPIYTIVEYISPAEMLFVILSVIIWEGRMSRRPLGRAHTFMISGGVWEAE